MCRILLVEDDLKLAKVVGEYLTANNFQVLHEPDGARAGGRILDENPDLVILDIMLPGKDGLTICREVRPRYAGPILMLTALGEETDEVVGLELGADDYLAKPVRPRLLLTRINALLRRTSRQERLSAADEELEPRVHIGSLEVDTANRTVHLGDQVIELTTAEFDLLLYFARHVGKVLTRDQIYRDVRGIEYNGLDRSIDLRIARLRRKLGDDGKQPQRIKSIRGAGYLMVEDQ